MQLPGMAHFAPSPPYLGQGIHRSGMPVQAQAEKVLQTWRRESLFAPDTLSEYEVRCATCSSNGCIPTLSSTCC